MMSSLITLGGKPLSLGAKLALYAAAKDSIAQNPQPAAPMPTTGMSGWWDASSLNWGTTVNTLSDKSAAGVSASTGGAIAVPRLASALGGLYVEGNIWMSPFNLAYIHPLIADYSVSASNVAVGAGGAFTVFLVWSRPNQYQPQPGTGFSTQSVPLLNINGTTVLSMTGNGNGADVLTLSPAGGTTQTAGTLELRHTHSMRLVFSGSTVDLWLDSTALITGASCTQLTGPVTLSFLNAAQCIFHEAAAWSHALSGSENSDLSGYSQRWPLGARRAINGVMIGQSNADHQIGQANNYVTAKRVAYLTGCISSNFMAADGGSGQIRAGSTVFSGQGLYRTDDTQGNLFLAFDSTTDASTWQLGANGRAFLTALDSLSADQRANLLYVGWYWNESDATMLTYAEKPRYFAAMKRAFQLIRSHLYPSDSDTTAASKLPILVVNQIPSTTDIGAQTHKEVMADLAADTSQNCHFMLAQGDDAIGENDSFDPATGLESGAGNTAHRDTTGQALYARRFGIPIARAALAAGVVKGTTDVVASLDSSLPKIGGPKISYANYEGTTYAATGSVLVTVQHDGGNDLSVPMRAALGVGWTLMDGLSDTQAGDPGTPGTFITATACTRVSATQLRVTLASQPSHPAKAKLYYVYGSGLDSNGYAVIGQGNAVTDNFSSVTLTPGWQIGADMGAIEQVNNPLQATTYGIALT